jgi:hypothetical protein
MTQLPIDAASYPRRMDSLATPMQKPPNSKHKACNHCHHTSSVLSLRLLLSFKMEMLWFVTRGLLSIFLIKVNVTSQQLIMSNYKLSYSHRFKRNQQQFIIHNHTIHFMHSVVFCITILITMLCKILKLKVSALRILCSLLSATTALLDHKKTDCK